MSERMKLLIAYDGSECADAALADLRHAGLPRAAEALVLSVADVIVPPPINEEVDNTFPFYVPEGIRRAHAHAAQELERARLLAERAGERVRLLFPDWQVAHEAVADSPAWAIIKQADEWRPHLILVGTHGHNVLGGRIILGSVSQRVLYEARASVRVARCAAPSGEKPARIIIGMDGSPDAQAALAAVAARAWPQGSEAHVLVVLDADMSVLSDERAAATVKWLDADQAADREWARARFEPAAAQLREAGLLAAVEIRQGNPKRVLVEEAERWGADNIFLGAKGARGATRLLMGNVAATVAARAHCSVEVVRPRRTD